jgi:lysophospholipase L1-like esterase
MSKKILVLGNSITRHAPKADIGWFADWGMAASSEENDFVHILKKNVTRQSPQSVLIGINIASAERSYWDLNTLKELPEIVSALNFKPDIIIFRIGENVPGDKLNEHSFTDGFRNMVDFFNPDGNAAVILTTLFWNSDAKTAAIRAVGTERNYPVIELGDLGDKPQYRAEGLFEHKGVAAHPGDLGMSAIAERIWSVLKQYI